jgi:hypothetical protein
MADIDRPEDWISPRKIVRVTAARSAIVSDFQLLCEAGPYAFEVVVAELNSPPRLDFSGQVTMAGRTDQPVSDLTLAFIHGTTGDVVAHVVTDEFGEFACAVLKNGPYGIRLGEGEDAPVVKVLAG